VQGTAQYIDVDTDEESEGVEEKADEADRQVGGPRGRMLYIKTEAGVVAVKESMRSQ